MIASSAVTAVPHRQLGEGKPGDPLFLEWNTYLRNLERLLTDSQESSFVLIKGDTIVGVFATEELARAEGIKQFLLQPFLVKQIRSEEPLIRVRGYEFSWPNSAFPLAKPA